MTRPVTSSRLMLVEDRRGPTAAPASIAPLRRYRLARLRLDGRPAEAEERFEYLKRSHD
ncbi:MAG TPA: hypothetical protein VGI50_05755 [Solirubrobacteraceae bacterium]